MFKLLFDLPPELFEAVLAASIQARGNWKRVLRLRLVSRLFNREVMRIIHHLKMFDDMRIRIKVMGVIGVDYVSRRLICDPESIHPHWRSICKIVKTLLQSEGKEVDGEAYALYVKQLCQRAVDESARCGGSQPTMLFVCNRSSFDDDTPISTNLFNQDLISAAAYTNNVSVVTDLVKDERNLRWEPLWSEPTQCGIFGSPYVNAIIGGNESILGILFAAVRESENQSIQKLCHAMLMLAADYCSWHVFQSILIESGPLSGEKLLRTMRTSNIAAFDKLRDLELKLNDRPWTSATSQRLLYNAAKIGNREKVEHILNLKAVQFRHWSQRVIKYQPDPLPWWEIHGSGHLRDAINRGHEEVVQLLLDERAKVRNYILDYEVTEAAKYGRWNILWDLLARGGNVNAIFPYSGQCPTPLVSAVMWEREDVVHRLVQEGADVKGKIGYIAIRKARKRGLTSMVTCLEHHGARYRSNRDTAQKEKKQGQDEEEQKERAMDDQVDGITTRIGRI